MRIRIARSEPEVGQRGRLLHIQLVEVLIVLLNYSEVPWRLPQGILQPCSGVVFEHVWVFAHLGWWMLVGDVELLSRCVADYKEPTSIPFWLIPEHPLERTSFGKKICSRHNPSVPG